MAWYAERYTDRHGMELVPIEPLQKRPLSRDWGKNTLKTSDEARAYFMEHPDWNVGIVLGPSGYCSIDIDCWESFCILLEDFGVDQEELAGLPTIQGSPKGRRILFRVPEGASIDYRKLNWPSREDPTGEKHREIIKRSAEARKEGNEELSEQLREEARKYARYTVFELRAAGHGQQLQDVLPPSIHPGTGKPYAWIGKPARTREEWPEPPPWLIAIWEAWSDFEPQFMESCPWLPEAPAPTPSPAPARTSDQPSVIEAYIDSKDLGAELERYGYSRKGRGKRAKYLSPHSSTGLPGVYIDTCGKRCFIHHASDPLSGRPIDAFDLFMYYDHGGDQREAVKAAARELGMEKPARQPPRELPPAFEHPEPTDAEQESSTEPPATTTPARRSRFSAPFRALGYDGDRYYYLPESKGQVIGITSAGHTNPGNMMNLAPLEWWEAHFAKDPDNPSKGVNWIAATSACMQECNRAGVYDERNIRGRGAWFDDGRVVLHLGDRLLVDGETMDNTVIESKQIYEKRPSLEAAQDATPATNDEANMLNDIVHGLSWKSETHALFFAGWIVLAPICGAVDWRPHMWITAEKGVGKTWVTKNIVQPILGKSAYVAQSTTTEPGIRQELRRDARPVIIDEAESETKNGRERIQGILELARQSSTGAGEIVKGSSGGKSVSYLIRSMFCLLSINTAIRQASDESRFAVVELKKHKAGEAERFADFSKHVMRTLNDDFCARIRARSYQLIPIIRQNAATFSQAIAETEGSRRMGDQVGTLLAGALSLNSDQLISLEDATAFVREIDLEDASDAAEVDDGRMLLDAILQYTIMYEDDATRRHLSVAELIQAAAAPATSHSVPAMRRDAKNLLRRWGMVVDEQREIVAFANRHIKLEAILRDTPWAGNWAPVLGRVRGDNQKTNAVRFPEAFGELKPGQPAPKQRCVEITFEQLGVTKNGEWDL